MQKTKKSVECFSFFSPSHNFLALTFNICHFLLLSKSYCIKYTHIWDFYHALQVQSERHIKNTEDFVKRIKDIRVESDEVLVSYDVSSSFTCIPVNSAIEVDADLLKRDPTWKNKTDLSDDQVVKLLYLYLNSSYFVARDQFYQQCEGCTIGGSASPVIANLFIEHFDRAALQNSPITPKIWYWFVDDTSVILRKTDTEAFFEYINSQNPHIKFTCEPWG